MDSTLAATYQGRLRELRAEVARAGGAGVVVPLADEHGTEYVGAYAQRLRWLTGFTGTAGTAIVLAERAALFTDGRYAIQSREETDLAEFEIGVTPKADLANWISSHAERDAVIFYDPWLVSRAWLRRVKAALREDVRLAPSPGNLVDAVWLERPQPSLAPVEVHADAFAGVASRDKRAAIADSLRQAGNDAVVIAALDSVAWALNIRGRDISHTPVARAFLIVRADASAVLFVDPAKVGAAVLVHLGSDVEIAPYETFASVLGSIRDKRVVADPDVCAEAIFDALAHSSIVEARDPCVLPRALKNDVEIAGSRAAHLRDGVALTRFLFWLERRVLAEPLDEIEASDALLRFREQTGKLRELSFPTISAAGPSAALPHYVPKPGSARRLEHGSLYLVDSGAQYDDGTTDVTRTVAIGEPSLEMRRRFTQALRGHIAIAAALIPAGTTGGHVDALARQFLWQGGVDYASGTGHGVGSCLSVHEGPAYIGKRGGTRPTEEPIRARMILSDEPGFYREGAWGLRTENLYVVVERAGEDGEPGWLGFEPLTLAPIDRKLIDVGELSRSECEWIDAYHALVERSLIAHLSGEEAEWLGQMCRPLASRRVHEDVPA